MHNSDASRSQRCNAAGQAHHDLLDELRLITVSNLDCSMQHLLKFMWSLLHFACQQQCSHCYNLQSILLDSDTCRGSHLRFLDECWM